ncbi:MAG: hypothetical protein Q9162_007685 [Coniocarpon cinnabarinum]
MEAERLARIAKKRGAEEVSIPAEPPVKIRRTSPAPAKPETRPVTPPKSAATRQTPAPKTGFTTIKYPTGAIKRTVSSNHDRDGSDITLSEVLEPESVSIAVISTWQLDTRYLFSILPPSSAKLYLIMHSKHATDQATWRREAAEMSSRIRLCFPPLSPGPGGVMHSKLMLLSHPTKLRIVVPSANMMDYDWGETGFMENVIFLIDLPRLPEERQGNQNDTLTPFALDLIEYLQAQTVDQSVRDSVLKFDFSQTAHLAFVNTVAGAHTESEALKTGFPQLAGAVRQLGLATQSNEAIQIDYAAGSIGKIDSRIFADLYNAFRGVGPSTTPSPAPPDNIRVHFPSHETVNSSMGGSDSAGTLFFAPQTDKNFMHSENFLDRFRDARSTRSGLLSHAKMALVRTKNHAFVYVGSANASQAAWGKWVQGKRKGAEGKLTAANWECGVLIRLDDVENKGQDSATAKESGKDGEHGVVELKGLEGKVPLMFEIPGKRYDDGGVPRKPWMG